MKLKSHSGAKKRFKITSKGKLLRRGAAISHLLTNKNRVGTKKRHGFNNPISKNDEKILRTLLPYSKQ